MEDAANTITDVQAGDASPGDHRAPGDDVTVRWWFLFYVLFLIALAGPLGLLLAGEKWRWTWRPDEIGRQLQGMGPAIKLLAFGFYVSLCGTFFPLPTNAMVAAVAARQTAVTGELWSTVLLVALVGAVASTVANLNDYHLMTWMLRNRRLARVRHTRLYDVSARWFARRAFLILVVFNVLPIPIDVVRMLATTYRYPRRLFAAANFIGRFVRYGAIAFVTFYWNLGWVAAAVLLALALVMVAARAAAGTLRRRSGTDGKSADAGTLS